MSKACKLLDYNKFLFENTVESELENISFMPESRDEWDEYLESDSGKLIRASTYVYCEGNPIRIENYYSIFYRIITSNLDCNLFYKSFCKKESYVNNSDSYSESDSDSDSEDFNGFCAICGGTYIECVVNPELVLKDDPTAIDFEVCLKCNSS